jgi:hypothetical protein
LKLSQAVFVGGKPQLSGSELCLPLFSEQHADSLLQLWIHSEASGEMTLTPAACSFGPTTFTKAAISAPVYNVVA